MEGLAGGGPVGATGEHGGSSAPEVSAPLDRRSDHSLSFKDVGIRSRPRRMVEEEPELHLLSVLDEPLALVNDIDDLFRFQAYVW